MKKKRPTGKEGPAVIYSVEMAEAYCHKMGWPVSHGFAWIGVDGLLETRRQGKAKTARQLPANHIPVVFYRAGSAFELALAPQVRAQLERDEGREIDATSKPWVMSLKRLRSEKAKRIQTLADLEQIVCLLESIQKANPDGFGIKRQKELAHARGTVQLTRRCVARFDEVEEKENLLLQKLDSLVELLPPLTRCKTRMLNGLLLTDAIQSAYYLGLEAGSAIAALQNPDLISLSVRIGAGKGPTYRQEMVRECLAALRDAGNTKPTTREVGDSLCLRTCPKTGLKIHWSKDDPEKIDWTVGRPTGVRGLYSLMKKARVSLHV